MGLREGSYAKVWSVKKNGLAYSAHITVSKKDKETGEYKTLFGGFVNFAGEAGKKAEALGLPETMDKENPVSRNIHITTSPDITSWYNQAKVKKLIALANNNLELIACIKNSADTKTITIWDFELAEDGNENNTKAGTNNLTSKSKKTAEPAESDDELPF